MEWYMIAAMSVLLLSVLATVLTMAWWAKGLAEQSALVTAQASKLQEAYHILLHEYTTATSKAIAALREASDLVEAQVAELEYWGEVTEEEK